MWSLSWSRSRRDSLSRPVCRPWRPENSSDSGKDGPQLSGKLPGKVNERVVRPSLRLFVFEARLSLLHVDADARQPLSQSPSTPRSQPGIGIPASSETIKAGGGGVRGGQSRSLGIRCSVKSTKFD